MIKENDVSRSLHEQLSVLIAGTESGEQLPSEPKLADDFGVSRASLREAMRTFETRGLLQRQQGVGTFVIHPTHVFDSGLENNINFSEYGQGSQSYILKIPYWCRNNIEYSQHILAKVPNLD